MSDSFKGSKNDGCPGSSATKEGQGIVSSFSSSTWNHSVGNGGCDISLFWLPLLLT